MERPLVSIVTPSYQQAQFIGSNLASIAAQDYPRIEHVVRDGGSSDGTVDILRASATTWASHPDGGQTQALNNAIAESHGEIIGWVNSDDYLFPGAVESAVSALQASSADVIYGACTIVDEVGQRIGEYRSEPFSYERLLLRNIVPQPAVFFRRRVFDRYGPFDETLNYAMDYEYWLRCSRSVPFLYVPRVLAAYRIHGSSKTVRSARAHAAEANMLRLRYGRHVLPMWRLQLACLRTTLGGIAKSTSLGLGFVRRLFWQRNSHRT